ncbi:hypothetical protein MKY34_19615 [Sporosarcina sp. FSL K6-1522]|uniref:hypothetical protein n=1 Tax=Sporosarcina sp. FSL K6-1522 TaxID=2921554 RepID=UPI00315AAA85
MKFMDLHLEKEEQEAEKERARVWLNYLTTIFTQPSYGKEDPQFKRARQDFIKAIQPEQKAEPAKVYNWDFELMKRLKAKEGRLNDGDGQGAAGEIHGRGEQHQSGVPTSAGGSGEVRSDVAGVYSTS